MTSPQSPHITLWMGLALGFAVLVVVVLVNYLFGVNILNLNR